MGNCEGCGDCNCGIEYDKFYDDPWNILISGSRVWKEEVKEEAEKESAAGLASLFE